MYVRPAVNVFAPSASWKVEVPRVNVFVSGVIAIPAVAKASMLLDVHAAATSVTTEITCPVRIILLPALYLSIGLAILRTGTGLAITCTNNEAVLNLPTELVTVTDTV